MATLIEKGHGQVELNQVRFRRDGAVEAQKPFKGSVNDYCENGMILAIDASAGCVRYGASTDKLFGLVYTSEELYDERHCGLKDFYLKAIGTGAGECEGPDGYNVLPRLGILDKGDRFTTNAISTTTLATADIGKFTWAGTDGYWTAPASAVATTAIGPVAQIAAITTMPDGQVAVKLEVITE